MSELLDGQISEGQDEQVDEFSPEKAEQNETKVYESIGAFLSAFEQSEFFREAYEEREAELLEKRPGIQLTPDGLVLGLRSTQSYSRALIDFFRAGHTIPANLDFYKGEAKEALEEYFKNLKSVARQTDLIRATSFDREDEEMKLFTATKTRDRYHVAAALALLGDGITLENGNHIVCDRMHPEDENAIPLDSYTILGRTLVTIIAEENHLDIVDPMRDQKKIEATTKFLNGLHYSGGHWLGKSER